MSKIIDIPHWKELSSDVEDGRREGIAESWRFQEQRNTTKVLYEQWRQFMYLVNGVLPEPETGSYLEKVVTTIQRDALLIAVKIRSSLLLHYVGKMEHAAIIRKQAQDVFLSLWSVRESGDLSEEHHQVLRQDFDRFREQFKAWVQTFDKDDITDEWGLF